MTAYYSKKRLSQSIINENAKDINDGYLLNTRTGEYINLFIEKKEVDNINRKYENFSIINKDPMINDILTLGPNKVYYIMTLISNLKYDNSVDFGLLNIKSSAIKKFKGEMKKLNIIKKVKLKGTTEYKYYINPNITAYGNAYKKELIDIFNI